MSDIVERLRAITTEAAERLAKWCGTRLPTIADALRSLAAERDALQAENEKMRAALKEIKSVAFVKPKDFEYRRVSLFAQIAQIAQVALGEKE